MALLVLGAGAEQRPLIASAQNLGFSVIAADRSEEALRKARPEVSLLSRAHGFSDLEDLMRANGVSDLVEGVVSFATDSTLTVAEIASRRKLRGPTPDQAATLTDKLLMKDLFARAGVHAPATWEVSSHEQVTGLVEKHPGQSFVLKPADGRGSIGVVRFDQNGLTEELFQHCLSHSALGYVLLQVWSEGEQVKAEGFLRRGDFWLLGLTRRDYTRLDETSPNVVEAGCVIDPEYSAKVSADITDAMRSVAGALGMSEGPLNADIVVSPSGIHFLEVSGRWSGGWLNSHQIPAANGVAVMEVAILHALGREISPDMLKPSRNLVSWTEYPILQEGKLSISPRSCEVRDLPGYVLAKLLRKEGEYIGKISCHADRPGVLIFCGRNLDEAKKRLELGRDFFGMEVRT